jgi:cell division protein FtsN
MVEKEKTSSKKKKSSTQWTRKGLTLWICLTFFACAWMFVLGIFVGRGTVPVRFDIEKLEKELAALKEEVIKKEFDRYKLDSPSEENKTQMEFYDALKSTGSEEKLKTNILQNKPKPIHKKSVSKVKKTLASKKTTTIRKKKTTTVKKSAQENKNFTIQVAAYKNSKIADNMVAKLKKKGYSAYKSIGKIPGKGIVYRVRIGYFKNRAEGSSTFNRLKKENIKAIIVQR